MSGRDRDDDELDDASLQSMRAVWLSMRDEEPPAAGMSALLAAARAKAEQMRPRPSWWERALAILRRPPVLAFATVMILIGGAVAITRRADEPVEAMRADQAPAREAAAAADDGVELRVRELAKEANEESEQGDAATSTATTTTPVTPTAKAKHRPAPRKAVKPDGSGEPDRNHRFDDGEAAGPAFGGEDKGGRTGGLVESPGRVSRTPAPPPIASPPEVPAPTPGTDARKQASATAPRAPATGAETLDGDGAGVKDRAESTAALAKRAEAAASRGDCTTVRALARTIAQRDAKFYEGWRARVARCL